MYSKYNNCFFKLWMALQVLIEVWHRGGHNDSQVKVANALLGDWVWHNIVGPIRLLKYLVSRSPHAEKVKEGPYKNINKIRVEKIVEVERKYHIADSHFYYSYKSNFTNFLHNWKLCRASPQCEHHAGQEKGFIEIISKAGKDLVPHILSCSIWQYVRFTRINSKIMR